MDRRRQRVERELSALDGNIRALSKGGRSTSRRKGTKLDVDAAALAMPVSRGSNFANLFAPSLETKRPLRVEQQLQRNKAIAMLLFTAIVLLGLLLRFFL